MFAVTAVPALLLAANPEPAGGFAEHTWAVVKLLVMLLIGLALLIWWLRRQA